MRGVDDVSSFSPYPCSNVPHTSVRTVPCLPSSCIFHALLDVVQTSFLGPNSSLSLPYHVAIPSQSFLSLSEEGCHLFY